MKASLNDGGGIDKQSQIYYLVLVYFWVRYYCIKMGEISFCCASKQRRKGFEVMMSWFGFTLLKLNILKEYQRAFL